MERVMMKCGHVAQSEINGKPVCTKTISGSHDKFFEIVRQVQEHGEVINPITEDEE